MKMSCHEFMLFFFPEYLQRKKQLLQDALDKEAKREKKAPLLNDGSRGREWT